MTFPLDKGTELQDPLLALRLSDLSALEDSIDCVHTVACLGMTWDSPTTIEQSACTDMIQTCMDTD